MEKIIIFILLISTTVGFRQFITDSLKILGTSSNEIDVEVTENFNAQELNSKEDENVKDKLSLGLKKFYKMDNTICESSIKKYENLVQTLDNYIQRYISLFLITSNLLDYKINDLQEQVTIDLELSISGEDLNYLQSYSKTGKESTHFRNLSKLDVIFSKIAKLKERSYLEKGFKFYWSNSFFIGHILSLLNNPNFCNFVPFIVILLMSWLVYNFLFNKLSVCFGMIINSMIIWDSFILYWKRLKEMDAEIYVATMHLQGQEDCNPANHKWYHGILSYFRSNQCLEYYKNLNKNPAEEVFLFKCIIDTYSYYLIQTPVRIFGSSIRDFCGEISDLWPWPFKYIISIPLAPIFVVIAVFFILIMCGKRLKLSFASAVLELGSDSNVLTSEKTAIKTISEPKRCHEIRKLKPWTKAKYIRKLDRDFGIRKKLPLKTWKSFFEAPHNDLNNSLDSSVNSNVTNSNETSNNSVKLNENIIKHD